MQPKTFNEAVKQAALEIAELVAKKQHDYGKGNILNSPVGPELGVIVRVSDKLNRLANLHKNHLDPNLESIEDNWQDVAGYALIALLYRKNQFELPLE